MDDHQTFVAHLPSDGSGIGNGALRQALAWQAARYERVRQALLAQGVIAKGRGRGGSVRRLNGAAGVRSKSIPSPAKPSGGRSPATDDQPTAAQAADPDPDRAAFLAALPADGSSIGNGALLRTLGWQQRRYERARAALLAQGVIAKGRGRGGSVRRVTPTARQQRHSPGQVAHQRSAAASDGATQPSAAADADRTGVRPVPSPDTPRQQTPVPRSAPPPAAPRKREGSPTMATAAVHSELVNFIWSICNLLRGPYKRNEYRKVILPLTVLRRFDCVLSPSKDAVLQADAKLQSRSEAIRFAKLREVAGVGFVNTSKLDFPRLLDDPGHIAEHLHGYINAFSPNVREIMERFKVAEQIDFMDSKNLLYKVVKAFAEVDLSPQRVSNLQMGYVFEELIRIGAEQANEEAGAHFTPREVIKLMVNLLFCEDASDLAAPGKVVTLYDPACGTGGMLSVAEEHLLDLNSSATVIPHGQDYNNESFAICKADMLIKGEDADKIALGNTFTEDQHADGRFAYMLSNPPFGVEWKQEQKHITDEHDKLGYKGRFGPGLPRINDGALLFLLHMCSKMRPPADGGSRIAIVFNGSPLFTGDAESGESEIRRWLIEHDYLEGIVSLPDQMFYNTGISTYVWIVSNHKPAERRGRVALINGSKLFVKMKKSLGNKRNKLGEGPAVNEPDHIGELTRAYGAFAESDMVKIFKGTDFAYRKITVERPLRLRFRIDQAGIGRLQAERVFQGLASSKKKGAAGSAELQLGMQLQQTIIKHLAAHLPESATPGSAELQLGTDTSAEHESLPGTGQSRAAERSMDYATAPLDQRGSAELELGAPGHCAPMFMNRVEFLKFLKPIFKDMERESGQKLPANIKKCLVMALSERDETAAICTDKQGNPEPDTSLRDTENVPWDEDIDAYMAREVLPHVPDAWVDTTKTKVGYEIPFTRHFYEYQPLRPLAEIEAEIKELEAEIQGMLGEVVG